MSYLQLFARFLKFGLLAWGGPVAQIGMLRRELVDEERWISSRRFNKLLAVMQVLPGPEAHEICVHLGIRAKGRLGGVLAGLGRRVGRQAGAVASVHRRDRGVGKAVEEDRRSLLGLAGRCRLAAHRRERRDRRLHAREPA